MFDCLVVAAQAPELIAGGFLVPAVHFAPQVPDLKGVAISHGDYNERQLAERVDQPLLVGGVVEHWLRYAERRRTIVFATNVAHSVHIRDDFRRAGVVAEHIDGSTPAKEREGILSRLGTGVVEVVTNCMVLTEGFDCPDVGCIVLARPTKSIGLFLQMAGRGMRAAPGKKNFIVMDHAGATFQHGFADDPVEWTLSPNKRAVNRARSVQGRNGGIPGLATCPECKAVRFSGRPCPICGWRPQPRSEEIGFREGDLARVGRDRTVQPIDSATKAAFHGMLVHIARERGYQPGWAAYKYKEKFGSWPVNRHAIPVAPNDACRAWVRSRQIAFAKSRARAGA